MDLTKYELDNNYFLDIFKKLLAIDSTTGQYKKIEEFICKTLDDLGYSYEKTNKGGVIVNVGGENNALAVTAHVDDIGLMVRHINPDGTLKVCSVGGLYAANSVCENVRVYTRDDKVYTGTICHMPSSIHVTEEEIRKTIPDFDKNICIVLDEDVKSKEDTIKLGIETGDYVSLDPKFNFVNGYLKSRFVDDKAAAAILFAILKLIKDKGIKLNRKVYFYFAMYEEIGHGTTYLPTDVKDMIAIDIAPTGPNQTSDERKVSIFAKDSRMPYHYDLTNELRDIAIKNNINYVLDIFTPHYGTDCDPSVMAGYDIRTAAIGFGTSNTHAYERTHMDGIKETYNLMLAYMLK